jgi:hypothetical protein
MIIKLLESLEAQKGDYLLIRDQSVRVVKQEVMELAQELAEVQKLGKEEVKEEHFPALAKAIVKQHSHKGEEKGTSIIRATKQALQDRRTLLVAALSSYNVPATAQQLASYAYGPKVTQRQIDEFGRDLALAFKLGVVERQTGTAPPPHGGIPPNWYKLKPNLGVTNEQLVERLMQNHKG